MDYFSHILILIGIYSILAVSLNVIVGYSGILSVGHAAFFGIGAYTSSILSLKLGFSFLFSTAAGSLLALLLSIFIGLPALRLKGDYLLMATLGFCAIVQTIFVQWKSVTNGPEGIMDIPKANFLSFKFDSNESYLLLTLFFLSITVFVINRLEKSPFGRILMAIREDDLVASTTGRNTAKFKVTSLAIGAFFAGIAGSLYAHFLSYIDPVSFTVEESILIFSMLILGGIGSISGAVLGAAILVILPEFFRFLGLPPSISLPLRQVLYGSALVLLMIIRPQGLLGKFKAK